jgi:hypothetical protein
MHYDNSAARLETILTQGMSIPRTRTCCDAWADLLGVQRNDSSRLFCRLSRVMDLPRQTHLLVKTYFPEHAQTAGIWREHLEAAFLRQQLYGHWESFLNNINPYCISHVSFVADLLNLKIRSCQPAPEVQADVEERLAALVRILEQSDALSAELVSYLSRELGELSQAVQDIGIAGVAPVLKQIESLVGHAVLDEAYYEFLNFHEIGGQLIDHLNGIAWAITGTQAAANSSAGFAPLLLA